jgi:hypothetical protein
VTARTRPQLAISEELNTIYVFLTAPNGGGVIYRKSAPLSGPNAFDFRGPADEIVKRGVTFIKSSSETLIDDASTTKQEVTSASGIAVIANNLLNKAGTNLKFYLHGFMALPRIGLHAAFGQRRDQRRCGHDEQSECRDVGPRD